MTYALAAVAARLHRRRRCSTTSSTPSRPRDGGRGVRGRRPGRRGRPRPAPLRRGPAASGCATWSILDAVPDAAENGLDRAPPRTLERMRAQAARFGAGRADPRRRHRQRRPRPRCAARPRPRLQLELICARVLLPGRRRASAPRPGWTGSSAASSGGLERRSVRGGVLPSRRREARPPPARRPPPSRARGGRLPRPRAAAGARGCRRRTTRTAARADGRRAGTRARAPADRPPPSSARRAVSSSRDRRGRRRRDAAAGRPAGGRCRRAAVRQMWPEVARARQGAQAGHLDAAHEQRAGRVRRRRVLVLGFGNAGARDSFSAAAATRSCGRRSSTSLGRRLAGRGRWSTRPAAASTRRAARQPRPEGPRADPPPRGRRRRRVAPAAPANGTPAPAPRPRRPAARRTTVGRRTTGGRRRRRRGRRLAGADLVARELGGTVSVSSARLRRPVSSSGARPRCRPRASRHRPDHVGARLAGAVGATGRRATGCTRAGGHASADLVAASWWISTRRCRAARSRRGEAGRRERREPLAHPVHGDPVADLERA